MDKRQDVLTKVIANGTSRQRKHDRQGYGEWVDRILNQHERYRLAHNWTRGTPKAPPLPTSATIAGVHYGHPAELGARYQKDWDQLWTHGNQQDLGA
eukprot:12430843-Karenia_brevis.AAC.1